VSYEVTPGRPGDPSHPRRERPVINERTVPDVGPYQRGTDASHWAMRRYLLTRALGVSVIRTVQWMGIAILLLAALVWVAHIKWLAVLIGLVAIAVLIVRALLSALGRRLTGVGGFGPAEAEVEAEVEAMVTQTRKGLRGELKRVGLPSSLWGPLLIALRLARPFRRIDTIRRLTQINLSTVVPAARLDELTLLLARRRSR